jgi:hypothetical protein
MALDIPVLALKTSPTQLLSDQSTDLRRSADPSLGSLDLAPVPDVQDVHILVAAQQKMH